MKVFHARNVNEALTLGTYYMKSSGVVTESRGLRVLEYPEPVCTVYECPTERMLINNNRKANPFFHLHEAMWILAGRQDVEYLKYFVPRMAEFSDDGKVFNAPYGYRLRTEHGKDQLAEVIKLLRKEPDTRRAVLSIWDVEKDLNTETKDHACNTTVYFKIIENELNMLVSCRSNDMLWGAYGANAVQFSVIQEYVASMVGVEVGVYRQVSDSFHVYLDGPGGKLWKSVSDNMNLATHVNPYKPSRMAPTPMVTEKSSWDWDLARFIDLPPNYGNGGVRANFVNDWFYMLLDLQEFYSMYRQGRNETKAAVDILRNELANSRPYYDIYYAAFEWLSSQEKN